MAWRFEPGEGVRSAFRRVSAEEIAKVRSGLTGPEDNRDKAIHEARQGFKRLRALVTNQLLGYSERRKSSVTRKLTLPYILPEDLEAPRTSRRRPLRPNEIKKAEVVLGS